MKQAARTLIGFLACFTSLAISATFAIEAIRTLASSNQELLVSFRGAAFEDVFGFGFWPLWFFLFLLQVTLLATVWKSVSTSKRFLISITLFAAFIAASIVQYISFIKELSLWQ